MSAERLPPAARAVAPAIGETQPRRTHAEQLVAMDRAQAKVDGVIAELDRIADRAAALKRRAAE